MKRRHNLAIATTGSKRRCYFASEAQFNWILARALIYLAGLLFYLNAFFKHHHAVWHLFVLGEAACHYVAIFGIFL